MSTRLLDWLLGRFARLTNRFRVWYRLPFALAMPTLVGHRVNMREQNLADTERDPPRIAPESAPSRRDQREADGSFNDLGAPWMGMAGARFGRNVPIAETFGEQPPGLYEPNPRLVSRELLARRMFVPVPHLNVLVPAWLQFMVHDWLSHGPTSAEKPHEIPLPQNDDWEDGEANKTGKMVVRRTMADRTLSPADDGQPATYRNTETHWWDGSQLYGSSRKRQLAVRSDGDKLREDGKIHLDENGMLPVDEDSKVKGVELSGVNGNWWLGLSVMHTLFAREHNAIVDCLRANYPAADGEWLFQKARLVNAALMAKIHTIEWTPALMNSPEGRFAMRGNWWGVFGEHFARAYGRVGQGEILSGIPGSPTDHHAAPYAMTEEFTAVYRMHSLLPDDFSIRRHGDDVEVANLDFKSVSGGATRDVYRQSSFDDVLYSLATSHPGALVLRNYPTGLRELSKKEEEGIVIDTATVDLVRDRERGVPRYCAFRRRLGMHVPKSFAQLTGNKEWQEALERIYGDVAKVDLLVGMLAEEAPPGFGFSDTAFRIFILMASRRLKSDRFFTTDFTPEVYTPAGFAWVRDNTFRSVLERHCPRLAPHFADLRGMFFPWDRGRS